MFTRAGTVKPITQDKFGVPPDDATEYDPETTGNCLQSCLASVFELPLSDVPHFGATAGDWFGTMQEWLRQRGLFVIVIPHGDEGWDSYMEAFPGMVLWNGVSRRGTRHIVVAQAGQLLHDPHPSRLGLEQVRETWLFASLDPSKALFV